MTNDLVRRTYEHKSKLIPGFTQKYNVDKLVYFEIFDDVNMAIAREKQIKKYSRIKKETLIDSLNEKWMDLYMDEKINWDISGSTVQNGNGIGK